VSGFQIRVITAMVFGIIVLGFIWMGNTWISILLFIIAVGSAYEYEKAVHTRSLGLYPILSAIGFLITYFYLSSKLCSYLVIINCLVALILIYWVFKKHNFFDHRRFGALINFVYTGISLGLLSNYISGIENPSLFFLTILVLIWLSDTGAYLIGSQLGKRKLLPRISPNKTVEGFIGAFLFTIIGAIVIFNTASMDHSLIWWLGLGICIWIFGALGDLVQSSIKRKYGIKDSGSFLPGHGGFWDRFDSLLLVTPFVLLFINLCS
jgi:phosphatidate cytidylyltransferase